MSEKKRADDAAADDIGALHLTECEGVLLIIASHDASYRPGTYWACPGRLRIKVRQPVRRSMQGWTDRTSSVPLRRSARRDRPLVSGAGGPSIVRCANRGMMRSLSRSTLNLLNPK